jgi:hypothetical protein
MEARISAADADDPIAASIFANCSRVICIPVPWFVLPLYPCPADGAVISVTAREISSPKQNPRTSERESRETGNLAESVKIEANRN